MPGRPTLSFAEAGRLGARRRWGEQRVVRLDQLDPRVAAAVRALIAADVAVQARAAVGDADPVSNEKAAAVIETPATATTEVRRASAEDSAA